MSESPYDEVKRRFKDVDMMFIATLSDERICEFFECTVKAASLVKAMAMSEYEKRKAEEEKRKAEETKARLHLQAEEEKRKAEETNARLLLQAEEEKRKAEEIKLEQMRLSLEETKLKAAANSLDGPPGQLSAKLDEIVDLIKTEQTEREIMSKANSQFTHQLLGGYGIRWHMAPTNQTKGKNYSFSWLGGEDLNTPNAVRTLKSMVQLKKIDGDDRALEFIDFNKRELLPLKAAGKMVTGCTDCLARLADKSNLEPGTTPAITNAVAVVEYKTNVAHLNRYQVLLELVSLSLGSQYEQAVVGLETDLNRQWMVLSFDAPNHINIEYFTNGSVAIETFKSLLKTTNLRLDQLRCAMPKTTPSSMDAALLSDAAGPRHVNTDLRNEQDLSGFGVSASPADHQQALQEMVNFLNDRYHANVTLPATAFAFSNEMNSSMYS